MRTLIRSSSELTLSLQLAGSGPKRQYFDLYNFRDYGITVA